jgi:hypothetical protein
MKTFIQIIAIAFLLLASKGFSQTENLEIYNSDSLEINRFQSFKVNDLPNRHIYIQLSYAHPGPNSTGGILKFNRQNNSWYNPASGFLNAHWRFDPFNTFWYCDQLNHFAVSLDDTNFIIRHTVNSRKWGWVEENFLTRNSGVNTQSSVNISEYSYFCGMDIDTTTDFKFGSDYYYYAYKTYLSSEVLTNVVLRVELFGTYPTSEVTAQLSSLKEYADGGFLKISPFNRDFIFVTGDNMMLSTSAGTNFFSISIPPVKKLIFSERDRRVYGFTSGKLYTSSNGGAAWDSSSLPVNFNVIESNPDSANILYAGADNGLYISRDKGINWTLYNNAFVPSRKVIGISKDNSSRDTLIVSTNKAVYKVWASQIVGADPIGNNLPDLFKLYQNYPNPFNPVTKIRFDIPSLAGSNNSEVRLVIYNSLGNEVATLLNSNLREGSYEVEFNGSDLPSGVYFCRLMYGGNFASAKMLLLK